MFKEDFNSAAESSVSKLTMLKKNPVGYFLLAMLAGVYVGFATTLTFTISGLLDGAPYTRILTGASFGVALSLVICAGSELFTGNNMVMASGIMKKKVKVTDALLLWVVCFLGNVVGSFVLGFIFNLTGLDSGNTATAIASATVTKTSLSALEMFTRGILCNMLVCLAAWCGIRCKSESGKLIMVFWCLYAFATAGFEHCVANMSLFSIALLNPAGMDVTVLGCLKNLGIVALGNMTGGIFFIALPYFIAALDKGEKK